MSNKAVELTDGTISGFLEEHPLAVVDFWHPLCGPCRELAPIIDELAEEYAGRCAFGKMNVNKNNSIDPYLRQKYLDGSGVPVLLFFKNGKRVDRILGYYPDKTPSIIRQIINRHL